MSMRPVFLLSLATLIVSPDAILGADGDADALVKGTPYHATGHLECRMDGAPDFGQCDFGVIRGRDGTATVVITRPDGYDRMLTFADGEFATEGDPVTTTSDNDGFTANVNGTEEYRIPYIVLDGDI
jgi:hypothetical protein